MTGSPPELNTGDSWEEPWRNRDSEELRRLLDRAVSASSNGIVITDPARPDNPIIYANPAFERMTGYSVEEVLGKNCRFLQEDARDQPQLNEIRDAVRERRECRTVLKNYRKDGTVFWNELYISPVHDSAGNLANFVGVQNDITERKQAEEERDLLLTREQLARAEAVKARRRLALLAEAGSRLSTSLDYRATMEQISRLIVPELADFCIVDIASDNGGPPKTTAIHSRSDREELLNRLVELRNRSERRTETVSRVIQSGRPELVSEASGDSLQSEAGNEEELEILRELGIHSYISVPLRARGRMLGVLTVASTNPGHLYNETDLSLMENLAHRSALALDNARLYYERSNIAHTLQQSLLPKLPQTPGLSVGVQYLPLGEENEVGGDFYDLIEVKDGWVAVIGDVVGKGAAAAAITALARYTIRAVTLHEYSPSSILNSLNEAMHGQLQDHQFCTVACARLRPAGAGAVLTVSRAGHPSPLILRANGAIEAVSPPGKFLGVLQDAGLGERVERLDPGDAAIFYTDGLTEARSPDDGAFYGEERLLELIRSCKGKSAPEIADELRAAAQQFAHGHPRDDLAVLVLQIPRQNT